MATQSIARPTANHFSKESAGGATRTGVASTAFGATVSGVPADDASAASAITQWGLFNPALKRRASEQSRMQSEEEILRRIPPFPYADLLDKQHFGDCRDELRDQGFAVVKEAIPREKALQYRARAFDWLAGHGYGFKKDDPATHTQEYLPMHFKGGMYHGGAYSMGQQQWVWDIRCEPGVVGAFANLWGTDELVCSFDGASLMLPGQGPKKGEPGSAWQHIDQHPLRKGFFVAQGIVNLNENGPDDGGLLVMKGSNKLMKQFFDLHGRPPLPDGTRIDSHTFSDEEKQWFIDQGCEWLKVCAGPGDLILWDSSTMHQNEPPSGTRDRMVTYVCMGPASLVSEQDKKVRDLAFQKGDGTSHAPFHGADSIPRSEGRIRPETGKPDPLFTQSLDPVKPTPQVLKLAGVVPY
ncbi:hypothetical protein MVLG_01676 [Microbotryum lychnidis-dioicae p1A1 Lamole]|uniref:Phytanoyl-CoA dioxygenase n=1 Tax=Microbotryum lychnidis-dioicae (strain p1A1 Lamole / MvSl-1064) TaxID=683840 RepID=U5H2U4_USTV1|nr:hypothetical protein MVLG_01676 [Microbotryum lychnidis-dioicae p1A1 Lamole]|eukprot:KDE08197.1 hypothetical protein MVLG_01676 [Microbotryum lychnidis-dioicae p1A1 Lamole]